MLQLTNRAKEMKRNEGSYVGRAELVLVSDVDVLDGDLQVVDDVPYHRRHHGLVLLRLG